MALVGAHTELNTRHWRDLRGSYGAPTRPAGED